LGYKGASSYQRYEDANLYTKDYLPLHLAERLVKALEGLGKPPITENEIMALAERPRKGKLAAIQIPFVSWVSAGAFERDDGQQDILGEISAVELNPKGDWIALRVEGDSMDRISPPGSIILVDRNDKMLVPNACYVIINGDGETTYKRFRPNPTRFEPVSTNTAHEPIYPSQDPIIVGRVRETKLKM